MAGKPKYIVDLTSKEREDLKKLISSGKTAARKITHARILLKSSQGKSEKEIAEALEVGTATVYRVRKRFVEEGLDVALNRKKPDRVYERKLDGDAEAHLLAMACSKAPNGRAKWSLRLLADKMVECEYVESISYAAIPGHGEKVSKIGAFKISLS